MLAVKDGAVDVIEYLVQQGADVNARRNTNYYDTYVGWEKLTPLFAIVVQLPSSTHLQ